MPQKHFQERRPWICSQLKLHYSKSYSMDEHIENSRLISLQKEDEQQLITFLLYNLNQSPKLGEPKKNLRNRVPPVPKRGKRGGLHFCRLC